MIENWNLSWSDIAMALTTAGPIAVVWGLACIYARQRRLHGLTAARVEQLAAATRAGSSARQARQARCDVIPRDERRR